MWPGRYRLELDLAEEGITWFKDKGSQTTSIDVEVNGGDEGRHITVAEDGFPLPSSDSPRLAFPYPQLAATGPHIIGGTCGLGTRVIARIVQQAGMFLGSNRNAAEDSLDIASRQWYRPLIAQWNTPMPNETYDRNRAGFGGGVENAFGVDRLFNEPATVGLETPSDHFLAPIFASSVCPDQVSASCARWS